MGYKERRSKPETMAIGELTQWLSLKEWEDLPKSHERSRSWNHDQTAQTAPTLDTIRPVREGADHARKKLRLYRKNMEKTREREPLTILLSEMEEVSKDLRALEIATS